MKTIMTFNHGLCSQFSPYLDTPTKSGILSSTTMPGNSVLPSLFTAIELGIADGSASNDGQTGATIALNESDIVSFMRAADERDPSPNGGFFLAFNGTINKVQSVPLLGDVNVQGQFISPFVWTLLDGRLTVAPLTDAGDANGNIFGKLTGGFAEALTDQLLLTELAKPLPTNANPVTLAETVFQKADRLQVFSGIPPVTCTQRAPGDDRIPLVADPTTPTGLPVTLCGGTGGFFFNLHASLLTSLTAGHFGNFVGVPATAFTQMWNDTVLAPQPNNPAFFKNVRCAPSPLSTLSAPVNTCQLVLPAERINTYPDGVELVLVDDDKEYNNPSFTLGWL